MYHPSNCCNEQKLYTALQTAARCEGRTEQVWKRALENSAACGSACCSPSGGPPVPDGSCPFRKILQSGLPTFGSDLESTPWKTYNVGAATSAKRGHSSCSAGLVLLAALDWTEQHAAGLNEGLQQAPVIPQDHGISGYHGFDSVKFCHWNFCRGSARSCIGCLFQAVPWGLWSSAEAKLLTILNRRLWPRPQPSAKKAQVGIWDPIYSDFSRIFEEDPHLPPKWLGSWLEVVQTLPEVMYAARAGISPYTFLPILKLLLLRLRDAPSHLPADTFHVIEGLHAMQAGMPFDRVPPWVFGEIFEVLAESRAKGEATAAEGLAGRTNRRPRCPRSRTQEMPGRVLRRVTATARLRVEMPREQGCGLASATWLTAYWEDTRSRCCPEEALTSLVRASAEAVNRGPLAALAACLLCEVAPTMEVAALQQVVESIDDYVPVNWFVYEDAMCGFSWDLVIFDLIGRSFCRQRPRLSRELPGGVVVAVVVVGQDPPAETAASLLAASASQQQQQQQQLQQLQQQQQQHQQHRKRKRLKMRSHQETLDFLKRGGSLVRLNDGEQQFLSREFSAPLVKPYDLLVRFEFLVQANCPNLCIALVPGLGNPEVQDEVLAIGPTHLAWWKERGLAMTQHNLDSGIFPPNRTYCFGLATYRPKATYSIEEFANVWDDIFADKRVLLVNPPDWRLGEEKALEQFRQRCGGCRKISPMLYGEGELLPPFRRAKQLFMIHPNALPFQAAVGQEWPHHFVGVRTAAAEAKANVIAVAWGPFGDILVAELACLSLQAIDVGNLLDILNGYEKDVDVDSANLYDSPRNLTTGGAG